MTRPRPNQASGPAPDGADPTTTSGSGGYDARRAARRQAREQQRSAAAERRAAGQRQQRIVLFAAGAIVLIIVIMLIVRFATRSSSGPAITAQPAPTEVVQAVTSVPQQTLDAVGRGSAVGLPTAVRGPMASGPNGHPLISYVGAEYCPYCAGERWAMVVALSRFGSFSNLDVTTSAANDVYPSTNTFSFVNSTYTSDVVDFSAKELQTNQPAPGGGYTQLQTPTTAERQMLQQYDAPPYVPANSAGAIPFVNFANQYISSGASFDVGVLQGLSWQQIASSLSNPDSAQAKAVLGAANVLTATICQLTNNQPANVCSSAVISQIENQLASQQPPSGAQ